jgi:hypothetical protein
MMPIRTPDHYATLETHRDATDAEIKRQYRKLMREVHPDANTSDPHANRKAARLNVAFEVLGDRERRRAYDAQFTPSRSSMRRHYEHVAEQEDWEDIVAETIPPRRPAHVHVPPPTIEPDEIEIDMAELQRSPRVRRTITVTNSCDCTLRGDVSTSEPWLWGPVGTFTVAPRETIEFDVEIVARKVRFPGISRVQFVTRDWTGTVPVKINGFSAKRRNIYPATNAAYVPNRRRRAVRR